MNYEEKFARAESSGQGGVFIRVDEQHPVGIFLGLDAGQRAILVVCPKRPPDAPSLAAIHVEARPRQGGEWALILRLARSDLKGLFTRLVEDLDVATRSRPEDPGEVVISRLVRWQRLMSRAPAGVLPDHQLRGLCAEIDFLLREVAVTLGVRAAVAAWVGPYDAPKDFVLSCAEVEVKAAYRLQRTLTISSLEQLTDGGLPLYLWSRVVELGPAGVASSNSVAGLIAEARAAAAGDPVATDGLDEALRVVGYEDRPEYVERPVSFGAVNCFRVTSKFPRLQRPDVSAAIDLCTYEIATIHLDEFRVPTWREALVDG